MLYNLIKLHPIWFITVNATFCLFINQLLLVPDCADRGADEAGGEVGKLEGEGEEVKRAPHQKFSSHQDQAAQTGQCH